MPQGGRPELEPEAAPVPPAPESAAIPLEPATAPPVAVPFGARGQEGLGGMRDVLALSTPAERRRFVLQLQRTAGNAAVCRWLGAVRERYADRQRRGERAGAPDDRDELEALLGGADDQPDGEDGPRHR